MPRKSRRDVLRKRKNENMSGERGFGPIIGYIDESTFQGI